MDHCDRVTVHKAFPKVSAVEILSNWETFLVAKVDLWPWSIMECITPMRRLLEFWSHVETRGTAQAEVEPGGPRQSLLETGPCVSSLTPTGPAEGKGNNSETAVPVVGSWRWYHPQQMRKKSYLSSPCLHPGMQPGKAEAPTAQEWKCSLPFLGRVGVKDVRWSKIELPQVLSWGGENNLINYVKRQNQLFQFTNKN